MIETVTVETINSLDDYAEHAHLSAAVAELRVEAARLAPGLRGRTVWMVNSTARGGGVAEMLPCVVGLLRELGVDTQWMVIGTDQLGFFDVTKRLHNLIHGEGAPRIEAEERAVYESVSRSLADELEPRLAPDDVLVVHDPQPCAMGAFLKQRLGLPAVWRCHIGLDADTPCTQAAWGLLEPHVSSYDHCVFSAAEYIPSFLSSHVSVITPAIDPLQPKNEPLSATALTGVLINAGLMPSAQPVVRPPFGRPAERLEPGGAFAAPVEDMGLLPRPLVTQISRWDRLKGFGPLLQGFAALKRGYRKVEGLSPREMRRIEITRLVLAGPEPAAVQDDPEAVDVLSEIVSAYKGLEPELQRDIAILSLPMSSLHENAMMVNALQTCSSIVAQNSLREGFGLTVTEAMWKRAAVLGSNACGIRQQLRHGIDGSINDQPEDPAAIADCLLDLLTDKAQRDRVARQGQRRVHDEFLVFTQVRKWLRTLSELVSRTSAPPPRSSRIPM